jgi:hypothetical protein
MQNFDRRLRISPFERESSAFALGLSQAKGLESRPEKVLASEQGHGTANRSG